jgi:hypothetical protein
MSRHPSFPCGRVRRRTFLSGLGMGFGGIALGSMLGRDGITRDGMMRGGESPAGVPPGMTRIAPKAKSVIWLFMLGGTSHLESFDPKPALNKYAGKTLAETPYNDAVVNSPFYRKNVRDFAGTLRNLMPKIYPLQIGYRPRGQSGIEISDWWPHVGRCADDLAVVRSMWTTDNDHAAQLQFHTGRHIFDGFFPSIGSWVHYGLGSLNDNLPQYVVLGSGPSECCGGGGAHGATYLGPEHAGVKLSVDPQNPLPFGAPPAPVYAEERRAQLDLLRDLNGLAGAEYPDDSAMRARIKAYELAFRMQMSVPGTMDLAGESKRTLAEYGFGNTATEPYGRMCLLARRLVERGVRFVQAYHDTSWDAHSKLKDNHTRNCERVDQPIGALLKDLKRRGLLDETLVVWGTEFGRTPGAEGSDGRDHHPYGFSIWLAGGGIRKGVVHGATDELGFHAVEHRHYITDLHATVLHQLGLDSRQLNVPGQKRLEIDYGSPIREIIA